ncbi:DMT family transporter [Nisaea acidiphila]|uniref:DMT family transporter n=1 Tax=Nisaea acidiphila TaxID=1862145 RepID=A0A9J7AW00_9PROT|nr:DMT family transporter [Nisaea acidiphila]UUX49605.1 DMT family transporter [Nisaea acidiphila]
MTKDRFGARDDAEGTRAGIGIMFAVTFAFSVMDTLTKMASQIYPAPQILWIRYMVFAGVTVADGLRRRGRYLFVSRAFVLQLTRGFLLSGEILVFIIALRHLPLADVQAIAAAGPLITTALSVPVLREQVGIRRWTAIGVGAVGVMIIIRPGFAAFDPMLLVPLFGISLYALYQVLTRRAARYDDAGTTVLYTGVTGLFAMTCVGPFFWITPDWQGLALMAGIGVIGLTGHGLLIKALSLAPASVLQPLNYLMLPWAVLWGYLIYDDLPDLATVIGAAIVVASGIYTFHRERVVRSVT